MFFDKMGGGAGMPAGMGGGGAGAFTSPGMNPQSLAALMAMFGGGGGGPSLPQPPAQMGGGPSMPPMPGIQRPGAMPSPAMPAMPQASPGPSGAAGGGLMEMLSKLDPATQQKILAMLGMGGAGGGMAPGMGVGSMPGLGTGGLY